MNIVDGTLPGIKIIQPQVFSDQRGLFMEFFHVQQYNLLGLQANFVQNNFSRSQKNVLRGLHFQTQQPQGKLIWVSRGAVLDVAVDIRLGSPTFGESFAVELNDSNYWQVYIPPGYAHGFYVLSEVADFIYQCTAYRHANFEHGIAWNDADLNIAWPCQNPIMSDKDRTYGLLKDVDLSFLPQYVPCTKPEKS